MGVMNETTTPTKGGAMTYDHRYKDLNAKRLVFNFDGSIEAYGEMLDGTTAWIWIHVADDTSIEDLRYEPDPYGEAIDRARTAIRNALTHEGSMSEGEKANLIAIEEFVRTRDNG
jgi:hypothetical protein